MVEKTWWEKVILFNFALVNNKDTKATSVMSFWFLYCYRWTDFKHCCSVSIFDFEQINASWEIVSFKLRTYVLLYKLNFNNAIMHEGFIFKNRSCPESLEFICLLWKLWFDLVYLFHVLMETFSLLDGSELNDVFCTT